MRGYRKVGRSCLTFGLTVCTLVWTACGEKVPDDPAEYQELISHPASGLLKKHVVNDVRLAMQYVPPELLALRDSKKQGTDLDRVMAQYQQSMTFVIHIDTKEREGDILGKDLQGFDDYQQRMHLLNFGIKNYVRLETADTLLQPVLGTMENTYSLTTGRNLTVVFAGNAKSILGDSKSFDIVFDDPVFGTGINRFHYSTSDILQAPTPQI